MFLRLQWAAQVGGRGHQPQQPLGYAQDKHRHNIVDIIFQGPKSTTTVLRLSREGETSWLHKQFPPDQKNVQ